MQSIDEKTVQTEKYVPASSLKEMTLTSEQMFQLAKENICDSFMDSMVQVATKNGAMSYSAKLFANMDPLLMAEIGQRFKDLGYLVQLSEAQKSDVVGQDFIVMTINWKNA
jgi:hypothetical protein